MRRVTRDNQVAGAVLRRTASFSHQFSVISSQSKHRETARWEVVTEN
jgi:hypothetical protein